MAAATQVEAPAVEPLGFQRFLGRSAAYALGPLVARALGLVTLPFVTRALGPAEFGRLEVLSALATAVAAVLLFGMDSTTLAQFKQAATSAQRRRVFPSALTVSIGLTLGVTALLWLGRGPFVRGLINESGYGSAMAPIGLYGVALGLAHIARAALRATDRSTAYLVSTLAMAVGTTAAVIVVVVSAPTAFGMLTAAVVGAATGGLVALVLARDLFRAAPDRITQRELLVLGAPQGLATALLMVGDVAQRWFLLDVHGPEAVGSLGLAVRLSVAIAFLSVGIQTAWYPRAFGLLEHERGLEVMARDALRIGALIALAATVFAAIAPETVSLVGSSLFAESLRPVGWMMVAAMGLAVFHVVTVSNVVARAFGTLSVASGLGMVAGLLLAITLVPRFGATGTAASLAFGQWVAVLVVVAGNQRADRAVVPLRDAVSAQVLPAAACLVLTLQEHPLALRAACVALVAGLTLFNFRRTVAAVGATSTIEERA